MDVEGWVHRAEVVRIGRHDGVAPLACAQGNTRIHNIGGSAHAEQLPNCPRSGIVEANNLDKGRTQQACQPYLLRTVAPHLCNDSRWNRKLSLAFNGTRDQRYNRPSSALERNQRACVEGRAGHVSDRGRRRLPGAPWRSEARRSRRASR